MSRVIIAGPRDLTVSTRVVGNAIKGSGFDVTEIVHGGAVGIDACAEQYALVYRKPRTTFLADWSTHGRAAGPIRNREMAKYADAVIVIKRRGEWTAGTSSVYREAGHLPRYVYEVSA